MLSPFFYQKTDIMSIKQAFENLESIRDQMRKEKTPTYNSLHPLIVDAKSIIENNFSEGKAERIMFHLKDELETLETYLELNNKNDPKSRKRARNIIDSTKDDIAEEINVFINHKIIDYDFWK